MGNIISILVILNHNKSDYYLDDDIDNESCCCSVDGLN